MKFLRCDQLSFGYNNETLLFKDLNLSLKSLNPGKGSVIALMGPSGRGKTTLLNLLLQTLSPTKGAIASNPANPVISYVPQDPVLFDHLSPEQNARYFSRIHSMSLSTRGSLW